MSRTEPPRYRSAPLLFAVLLLALLPWASRLLSDGELSRSPRETWTSIAASAVAITFGVWILVLLRREREINARHLADLEALTLSDPLTGLGNRRALERELARTMLRSRRLDHALALLYLDVNELKLVNDRFGHAAGDDTLRALGATLRQCSRDGADSGYRVGGDEFVLIVLADRDGAERLARRIADGFQARSPHQSRLSSGVVEWDGALSASEFLNEADRRMYRNKHMTRASTPVSDPEKD
jgi:diguanylate cyclase (GGDEF)-like protein